MFDHLSQGLTAAIDRLRGQRKLRTGDIDETLIAIRRVLLEADVALDVVERIGEQVRIRAMGDRLVKGVLASDQIARTVRDVIAELLTPPAGFSLNLTGTSEAAAVMLVVGLQGAGKTTTTIKLARHLIDQQQRRVAVVSVDVHRPAAMEQLAVLAHSAGVEVVDSQPSQSPLEIVRVALEHARRKGMDLLLVDSAGRTTVDAAMMTELVDVQRFLGDHCARVKSDLFTMIVADALVGQDAVVTAAAFAQSVNLHGAVMTRADGDGRGGAVLAMQQVARCPVLFLGTGEQMSDLEVVDPVRLAGRILGMGDVVALVEKASAVMDSREAEDLAGRMMRGAFDLNDLATQLRSLTKAGGLQAMLSLVPGARKLMDRRQGTLDERQIVRQLACIDSMTPFERAHPEAIHASRRRRIARGAGVAIVEVTRLLKQHQQMAGMMKKMQKRGMPEALTSLTESSDGGSLSGASAEGMVPSSSALSLTDWIGGGSLPDSASLLNPGLGTGARRTKRR